MMIPIADVQVGERRREEYGDLEGLARSIQEHGLLHPIVVDSDMCLVVGERRLRACKMLGWTEIEVKQLGELSEQELREIELEENLRRKDLTEYELSKNMVALAEVKAEKLRGGFWAEFAQNPQGGRPVKPDSQARIAEAIGIPRKTLADAQAHIKAVDEFPELKTFPKMAAIEAAQKLRQMPEPVREEKLHGLREKQAEGKKQLAHIDEAYRVQAIYHDAITKPMLAVVEDNWLEMWRETLEPEDYHQYTEWIDKAILNLTTLQRFLEDAQRPQIIKGGRSL